MKIKDEVYLLEPGKFLMDATNKYLRNILEKVVKRQKTNLMMVSLYDEHLTELNQFCLLIELSVMSLMVKEMKNLVLTQSYYKSLFDMKNLD